MANPKDFRAVSAFALAFAEQYKKYMKAHGVKQRQIAEHMKVTEAYVSERVNGKRALDANDVDALAVLSDTTGRSLMIELARLTKEQLHRQSTGLNALADQLDKATGRKRGYSLAANDDRNKEVESGREDME